MAHSELAATQCPALPTYSRQFLNEAADALDALPTGSPLRVMITDYGKIRDACRVLR